GVKLGSVRSLSTVVSKVATPEKGHYAAWQFTLGNRLLGVFNFRNPAFNQLSQAEAEKLRASLLKLTELVDAARAVAANGAAPADERREAVGLLGRDTDHVKEDIGILAGLLVPQTSEELQSAAV